MRSLMRDRSPHCSLLRYRLLAVLRALIPTSMPSSARKVKLPTEPYAVGHDIVRDEAMPQR